MRFNIQERLTLLTVLFGAEGNLATVRIVKDLQHELGLSEEEHKAINLREEDGRLHWDQGKIPPKEISVGSAGLNTMLTMFKRLDSREKLTTDFLPLYERLLKEKHESTPKLHEAGKPAG